MRDNLFTVVLCASFIEVFVSKNVVSKISPEISHTASDTANKHAATKLIIFRSPETLTYVTLPLNYSFYGRLHRLAGRPYLFQPLLELFLLNVIPSEKKMGRIFLLHLQHTIRKRHVT